MAALVLMLFTAPAHTQVPDGLVLNGLALEYRVLRDGAEIGRHRVRFSHRDGQLIVETEVRIAVTFLFVTLYRYELDARESWRDGRLVALASVIDDDGDRYAVNAVSDGETISVEAGANSWTAPATVAPSSLWHRGMARGALLLGIEQGERIAVAFDEVGREAVTARGVVRWRRPTWWRVAISSASCGMTTTAFWCTSAWSPGTARTSSICSSDIQSREPRYPVIRPDRP